MIPKDMNSYIKASKNLKPSKLANKSFKRRKKKDKARNYLKRATERITIEKNNREEENTRN